MNDETSIGTLHPIEKSLLDTLAKLESGISLEKLVDMTNLDIDQVRRGVEWLKFKNLISLKETSVNIIQLGTKGQLAIQNGLPERRLVNTIKSIKGQSIAVNTLLHETSKNLFQEGKEISAAFENALRNKWIEQKKSQSDEKLVVLTRLANGLSTQEELLQKLSKHAYIEIPSLNHKEKEAYNLLKRRPDYLIEKKQKNVEITLSKYGKEQMRSYINKDSIMSKTDLKKRGHLTQEMITSGRWRNVTLSPLDVEAPCPLLSPGRKHPLADLIDEIKEIFVGLGFTEIDGPLVQSGFWNFDALFTPQDHPSREMQDTFYVSGMKQSKFATIEQIDGISGIHKKRWGYEWDIEEAKRAVIRTHTTCVTIKYLADRKPENARVFSIGRVFRNEKLSYKHLAEFSQIEGVVTDRNITLRGLMGLQTEFYSKLGIKKVKFWPTFFPYTEPSLQSMVYNDMLEKWVELFGMGIFRPEIAETFKLTNPVLAWGGGVERIAMLRFGLNDLRDLYNNRLDWLRSVPKCQL